MQVSLQCCQIKTNYHLVCLDLMQMAPICKLETTFITLLTT